jgi:hypothetical protein
MRRRYFLKGMAAGGAALATGGLSVPFTALGQTPPSCPPAPVNGIPFRRGQDTRPVVQRQSVSSLSSSQLAQLRTAFARLRALPATDNRSWAIQADMHALYCQACNHDLVQSVHGSWNFFPWHRAFLYYFERILGSLVGNINSFRLPYWDWENHRFMPEPYGVPGNKTNPLWDANRYSLIAQGRNLPSTDGTAARIALLDGITDFATFGGTARSGGACESNPHDPIHDDIGLHTSPFHDMGHLGFAARDPIFFAHHGNIDKIWANWNALAAHSAPPAYRNPTDPAFLSERWNFYDENRRVVSISAADVLNYSTNLRYSYPAPPSHSSVSAEAAISDTALPRTAPVVSTYAARLVYSGASPTVDVPYAVKVSALQAVTQHSSVAIVLRGVTLPENAEGVFDVMSIRGSSMKHLGIVAIVGDAMRMSPLPRTVLLDATEAVEDLFNSSNPAKLALVPREGNSAFTLQAEDVDLRVVSRY